MATTHHRAHVRPHQGHDLAKHLASHDVQRLRVPRLLLLLLRHLFLPPKPHGEAHTHVRDDRA
jgi:protein-L-isoaspartate O-methyltransferase